MRQFTFGMWLGIALLFAMPDRTPAAPVERPAPAHLNSAYDRFKDVRTVSTNAENSALLSDTPVLLMAQFACTGDTITRPDTVRLVFLSKEEALGTADHLAFLVEGRRVTVPSLKHEHDSGSGVRDRMRFVSAYLSAGEFVQLARAKQVEGQLGSVEFAITSDLFETLQAMASLIQSLPREAGADSSPAKSRSRPRGTPGGTGVTNTGGAATIRPSQRQAADAVSANASPKTPSGKPEVVVLGASKKAVIDALVNQMTGRGYSIGKIDDYRAQFERPGGFWLNVLMGSKFNSNAIWRVSFSVFDSEGGVRVIADMGAVTNPGSGFEKVTEVKGGKNAAGVQGMLEEVRRETEHVPVAIPSVPDTTARK